MSHLNFLIMAFSTHFCPLKKGSTCLVTLFERKLYAFKNSPKWIIFDYPIFDIFIELLSTQNVNVARFARSVK